MKIFFISTVFLISLFFQTEVTYANDKIVGGVLADADKVVTNYIVSIGGGCAGSIIASKWILTAAHCRPVISRFVTAGHVNLRSKERIKLEIKTSYVHPKYNEKTYSYDFALIELKYAIHFENMGLSRIELVTPELAAKGAIDVGVIATALGWGSVREDGAYSNLLMQLDLPIVSRDLANAPGAYNGLVDESMIPAGFTKGGKDTCQGDSGGPFTVVGSAGLPLLAGVISWGHGCARANHYGLYAKVAAAHSWILEKVPADLR